MPNLARLQRDRLRRLYGPDHRVFPTRPRNGLDIRPPAFEVARGRHRLHLIRFTGPVHTRAGEEIDTDLTSGSGGVVAQANVATLDYGYELRDGGVRRVYPRRGRDEWVEFGRPRFGAGWEQPDLGAPAVEANHARWSTAFCEVDTHLTGNAVKVSVVYRDPQSMRRVAWPMRLSGLRRVGWDLISGADGRVVARFRPPVWWDAGGRHLGRVRSRFVPVDGGEWLAYDAPAVPDSVAWPVTVDPSISVDVAAEADDGHADTDASSLTTTGDIYMGDGVGQDYAWFRFDNLTLAAATPIVSAALTVNVSANSGSPYYSIWVLDEKDAAAPTTFAEWQTDHANHGPLGVAGRVTATGSQALKGFGAAFQLLVSRSDWASGDAAMIHVDWEAAANDYCRMRSYGAGGADIPQLDVTYDTAYPYIVDVSTDAASPISYPAAGMDSGNLVLSIAAANRYTAQAGSFAWDAEMTELFDVMGNVSSRRTIHAAAYREVTEGEGADFTLTPSQTDIRHVLTLTIANCDPPSTTPPEAATSVAGPDPPSLTPSWGSDTNLWITTHARFSADRDEDPPAGWEPLWVPYYGYLSVAYKLADAASQDPGAFEVDDIYGEAVATLAVRAVTVTGGPPKRLVIPGMQTASLLSAHRAREI